MNRLQANICLLCVTLCWSLEPILYSCVPEGVPSFATTCVTSFAGCLLLFFAFYRRVIDEVRQNGCKLFRNCLVLAVLSAGYNTMYLDGMKSFDVATGAFTFCMTVVVLPVVLLSVKRSVSNETWISVLLVLTGIVLALGPSLKGNQIPGLAILGVGCFLRAIGIVILADMAKKHDPLSIAFFLEFFASILSLGGWYLEDSRLFFGLPASRTLIATWAIHAYFVVAIASALNFFALRRVTATNATIVYSLEIVFTLIWGSTLPDGLFEQVKLSPSIVLGAVLVTIGSLTEIIDIRGKRSQREKHSMGDAT